MKVMITGLSETEKARRAYQEEKAREWREKMAKAQQEEDDYRNSEQCKRDSWEHYQKVRQKAAAKRGYVYTPKPFVTALERQQMEEQRRREEVAFHEEKIKELQNK